MAFSFRGVTTCSLPHALKESSSFMADRDANP